MSIEKYVFFFEISSCEYIIHLSQRLISSLYAGYFKYAVSEYKDWNMKLKYRRLDYKLVLYVTAVSVGFIWLGCSSKNNGEEKAKPSSEEEIELLKQENDKLKTTVARLLIYREEVKRLKQKNDELKKASADVLLGKKQREKTGSRLDTDKVEAIVAEFQSQVSAERKIELIKSLAEAAPVDERYVISVVQKALDDSNPEVGRAAITLLEDYEVPEILPVVEKALNSQDERVRIAALMPLSNINDPQVAGLLGRALNDTFEEVRSAALIAAQEQDGSIMLDVMEKGIMSPYNDVKYTVASILQDRSDHIAFEILIEGLKSTDTVFREEVSEVLDFLVDRRFSSYEEARAWWLENKDNYDENLFIVEEK